MNERIKEIANRAGFDPVSIVAFDIKEDLEKFAYLIVSQCAGIYDTIDNGNLHMGTDNYLETFRS